MIHYKNITKIIDHREPVAITCDICGKDYDDILDIQEFHYIRRAGGYRSKFGDETSVECDICDSCLYEFVKGKYRVIEED